MKRITFMVLFFAGCGSVGSSPDARGSGGGSDAAIDGAIDAPAAPRCNPASAFQTPVALAALNTIANETGATLSADELTLYFCSNRSGGPGNGDIWYATRASRTASWGAPQVLPTVNTAAGNECVSSVTADGLTMYLHVPANATSLDIAISTRATTNAAWGAYTLPGLPFNAAGGVADAHARVSPDGNTVYFSTTRNGANEDLVYVKRTNGVWGNPVAVAGIPTAAVEVAPVFTADELSLYYESYNAGGEIMLATRANTTASFAGIQPQTVFNTSTNDEEPDYLTADGCELYFTRVTATDAELFVARRGM